MFQYLLNPQKAFNILRRESITKDLFEEQIGLKDTIKDLIDIDYSKIHSGNIVDMLYRFTNTLLITQDKNNLYIVTSSGTKVFNLEYWMSTKEMPEKIIIATKTNGTYEIPNVGKIDDIDSTTVNGIEYILIRGDRKLFIITTLHAKTYNMYMITDDFDKVQRCEFIADKNDVYVMIKGIKDKQHIIIYYTVDKFIPVHYKITDMFGNVTYSGSYLPRT